MLPKRKQKTKTEKLVPGSHPPSGVRAVQFDSPFPDYVSMASAASATSVNPGLDLPLQKQLAEDIEANGGLEKFISQKGSGYNSVLASFLDTKPEVYRPRGDPIRHQIQNRVYKWKNLFKNGKYVEKVLNDLQVKSYQYRLASGLISVDDDLLDIDESDSSLSGGSDSDAGTIDRSVRRTVRRTKQTKFKMPTKPFKGPQAPLEPIHLSLQVLSVEEDSAEHAMSSPRRDFPQVPSDSQRIKVNLQNPEKNGPFTILPVADFTGVEKNKMYPGFSIFMETDIRYSFDSRKDGQEYFLAKVCLSNFILIRVPSWDYCLMDNGDRDVSKSFSMLENTPSSRDYRGGVLR
jgi:hypothetical protein